MFDEVWHLPESSLLFRDSKGLPADLQPVLKKIEVSSDKVINTWEYVLVNLDLLKVIFLRILPMRNHR